MQFSSATYMTGQHLNFVLTGPLDLPSAENIEIVSEACRIFVKRPCDF